MSYDENSATRVRRLLSGRRDVVEKTMMGSLIFMVDGHMCCGLNRAGLMVRVGREGYELALALPHTQPLKIGTRSPAGFVRVDPEGYRADAALAVWVRRGIDCVSMLPAKRAALRKRRPAVR
jgi:TfoX/Sxy family transcriptional regulator of competence genes